MQVCKTIEALQEWPAIFDRVSMIASAEEGSTSDILGGDVAIVETFEDLHKIPTTFEPSEDRNAGYISLVDGFLPLTSLPCGYDVVDDRAVEGYVEIFLVTNNAGGPLWYIPNEIAKKSKNVEESILIFKENSKNDDNII